MDAAGGPTGGLPRWSFHSLKRFADARQRASLHLGWPRQRTRHQRHRRRDGGRRSDSDESHAVAPERLQDAGVHPGGPQLEARRALAGGAVARRHRRGGQHGAELQHRLQRDARFDRGARQLPGAGEPVGPGGEGPLAGLHRRLRPRDRRYPHPQRRRHRLQRHPQRRRPAPGGGRRDQPLRRAAPPRAPTCRSPLATPASRSARPPPARSPSPSRAPARRASRSAPASSPRRRTRR